MQGGRLREELERMKREFKEREGRWMEEKGEFERRIKDLESRDWKDGREIRGEKQKDEGTEERVKEIKRKMEMKQRQERKRNVVIKKIKISE